MDDSKLVKLPISLAIKINDILKSKINFTPRMDKFGILSFQFTLDELSLIDKLVFENPVMGAVEGIEMLPNLRSLKIKSTGNSYYTQDKYIFSISDKDGKSIAKCANMEFLEIENQARLSYIDVTNMKKLHSLSLSRCANLEEIDGLHMLSNLWAINLVGNEVLTCVTGLNNVIMDNLELTDVNLDVLLFPDAVGYQIGGNVDKKVINKLEEINVSYQEVLSNGKSIKINNYQMRQMHNRALEALIKYVPPYCDNKTVVVGIERYLAENVKYDLESLKNNHSHSYSSSNDMLSNLALGPIGGANGAYNAFIYNTCVCEGYTRAMQYLLRLSGIKSHNVHCISGEDKLHMAVDTGDDKYKTFNLPDDGYHSIISIDDVDYLYDDPCWNAGRYQNGDKSMPWTLLTKEEISRDHTLSFGEKNINNNTLRVPREVILSSMQSIDTYLVNLADVSDNKKKSM